MLSELDTYDWGEVFGFAGEPSAYNGANIEAADPCNTSIDLSPFTREDVLKVLGSSEGGNDGPCWIIVGLLKDGRYFCIEAGCDYTGWDCRAGGRTNIAEDMYEVIAFGLTDDGRQRTGLGL